MQIIDLIYSVTETEQRPTYFTINCGTAHTEMLCVLVEE